MSLCTASSGLSRCGRGRWGPCAQLQGCKHQVVHCIQGLLRGARAAQGCQWSAGTTVKL